MRIPGHVPSLAGRSLALAFALLGLGCALAPIGGLDDAARGILAGLPVAGAWWLVALALFLLGEGWPRRLGTSPHCRVCGYAYTEPRDRLLSTCPECGGPWRYYGGLARGRPASSASVLCAGALVLLLAALAALNRARLERAILENASVATLIAHACGPDSRLTRPAWDRLAVLKLAASEKDNLAESLLVKRRRVALLSTLEEAWIESYLVGSPRADLLDRADRTICDFRLEATATLRPDHYARVRLRWLSHDRDGSGPAGEYWVIIGGLRATGDTQAGPDLPPELFRVPAAAPPGREDIAIHLGDARASALLLDATLGPEGIYELSAPVWIALAPTRPVVTWSAEGTPLLSPPPLRLWKDEPRVTVVVRSP